MVPAVHTEANHVAGREKRSRRDDAAVGYDALHSDSALEADAAAESVTMPPPISVGARALAAALATTNSGTSVPTSAASIMSDQPPLSSAASAALGAGANPFSLPPSADMSVAPAARLLRLHDGAERQRGAAATSCFAHVCGDNPGLRLGDVVEFIGILDAAPQPRTEYTRAGMDDTATSALGKGWAESSHCDSFASELAELHPGRTHCAVPQLYVLLWRRLAASFPLVQPAWAPLDLLAHPGEAAAGAARSGTAP
ncbi:MAG: hypothetical protein EOO41_03085, partial [Methanobacteriota archaeon]